MSIIVLGNKFTPISALLRLSPYRGQKLRRSDRGKLTAKMKSKIKINNEKI